MRGTIAAHVELAVADSDNLASARMFMRDLVSGGRTVTPRSASPDGKVGGLNAVIGAARVHARAFRRCAEGRAVACLPQRHAMGGSFAPSGVSG